jgi:hypothetical protein
VAAMKKDTSVNVRLTSAERAELQRLADGAKRKLSDYIRLILQEHLEAERESASRSEKRKR